MKVFSVQMVVLKVLVLKEMVYVFQIAQANNVVVMVVEELVAGLVVLEKSAMALDNVYLYVLLENYVILLILVEIILVLEISVLMN